jgi:peptidoglycan/xylan/chitin deacetylase (PgdA/CDA1 family)
MNERSYCSFHPSREAQLRCHSCHRWLCDRCVQVLGEEVYCGRTCHLRDLGRRLTVPLLSALRGEVPRRWSLVVIAVTTLILLSVLMTLIVIQARLSASPSSPGAVLVPSPTPTRTPIPTVSGRLYRERGRWTVEAQGPPGSTLLLMVGDRPLQTLVLDESGHGRVTGLRLSGKSPQVRLIELARTEALLHEGTPAPTATRPPAPSATPRPSRTPTATPAPTRAPSRTPTTAPTRAQPTPTAAQPASPTRAPEPRPAASPVSRSQAPPVLHLVADAGPQLALTFDGGSSSNGTADLLDTLQELDLQVSIFLTGSFIERDAALVRRAVAEGHEIGNHTYTHPHLTTYASNRRSNLLPDMTREKLLTELRRTEEAFFTATGRRMAPIWRAPYGEENATLRTWALEAGYLHVRWSSVRGASLDARDWVDDEHSSLYQSSSSIMKRLLRFPRLDGGIVLMHLATHRSEPPWQSLPRLVTELRQRGLGLTSVSEMLSASPTWSHWLEQARRNHLRTYGPVPTSPPQSPPPEK